MSEENDYLHKRFERLGDRIAGVDKSVDQLRNFYFEFGRKLRDLDYRIGKLEKWIVQVDQTTARYIGQRIAYDKQLHRRADEVSGKIEDVHERISEVERVALPPLADDVAKLIGAGQDKSADKSKQLDRRRPKRKH